MSTQQWMESAHVEYSNTTHPEEVRELENYHDVLEKYQWEPAPPASLYTIQEDCNLQCAEDCMSLRLTQSLKVIDTCLVNRCDCYFSAASTFQTCTNTCKQACLFVEGTKDDINKCLDDLCMCNKPEPVAAPVAAVS